MRLVVDTSVLVGELLRNSGRTRLQDERLDLFLPEDMWDEFQVEMPRRAGAFARHRRLPEQRVEHLLARALEAVDSNVAVIDRPVYAAFEEEAARRSIRDPSDWPLVACSLAIDSGVWTNDQGLFGTGIATWVTPTVQAWLEHDLEG